MTPIPGYDGLFATKDGLIYTLRKRNGQLGDAPRLASQFKDTGGYFYISYNGLNHAVHRLVLLTFTGPCPPDMEGCHYDGNRTNNNHSNLRWDTRLGNAADQVRHGTGAILKGEKNLRAKYNRSQVLALRKRYDNGESINAIARAEGLPRSTVYDIVKRINWSHV